MVSRISLIAVLAMAAAACEPTGGTTSQTTEGPATEPTHQAVGEVLKLDPEGLRLITPGTDGSELVAFGTARDEVVPRLTAIEGEPTETGSMDDCGPGPLTFVTLGDGLRLWFAEGQFSGWESTGGVATLDGLSADADRSQLEAAGITSFTEDSLGEAFEAGGIFGILAPDGQQVEVLHVGDNCFMR